MSEVTEIGKEDLGKKRDYQQDNSGIKNHEIHEQSLRDPNDISLHFDNEYNTTATTTAATTTATTTKVTTTTFTIKKPSRFDLEGALNLVFARTKDKEWIVSSDDDTPKWMTFRLGHFGDVSVLGAIYRSNSSLSSSPCDVKQSHDDTDDLWDVRLATALGDEDNPPVVYAILVDVMMWQKEEGSTSATTTKRNEISPTTSVRSDSIETKTQDDHNDNNNMEKKTILLECKTKSIHDDSNILLDEVERDHTTNASLQNQLGAAALLTLEWENEKRILQVIWIYIDIKLTEHDLIKRRLIFRLSVLALMTDCELSLPQHFIDTFSPKDSKSSAI
jgi:hypothetical protein